MAVAEQDRAYKQGMVFGITLAEIVLLVIFCLLLTLGYVALKHRQSASSAATFSPDERRLVEKFMRQKPKDITIDDYWTTLVRSVELAEKHADELKKMRPLGPLLKIINDANLNTADPRIIEAFGKAIKDLAAKAKSGDANLGRHDLPQIIVISDVKGNNFALGDARLNPNLEQELKDKVIPTLIEYKKRYAVDIIEVVGHTDEANMAGRTSNLDTQLLPVLQGQLPPDSLSVSDNAGLGLARAVAVVRLLMSDGRLKDYKSILPLSAAQSTDLTGAIAKPLEPKDIPSRRRIEIRVRELQR